MGLDWKAIVRGVAPVLGTVISGGNPLAGGAMKLLSEALLGKPDGTEAELAAYVTQARPEDLVPLKKLELDYKARMQELGLRPLELEVQDRASARELFKVDTLPQKKISFLFLGGYFCLLAVMLLTSVVASFIGKAVTYPSEFKDMLFIMTGAVMTILAFWFGTTKASSEKTAALAASVPASSVVVNGKVLNGS